MAKGRQSWNSLDLIEQAWIAGKSSLNASALSSEGNSVPLKDCAIDTIHISTLGEYLADKKIKEGRSFDGDEIEGVREDKKLAQTYVIPVTLPNGQEVEVVVNKKGQDMACMYRDETGEHEFELTPRMKKEINKGLEEFVPENLEDIIGESFVKEIKGEYFPENVEELAENISKDELLPKGKEDVLKKVNEKTGSIDEQEQEEEKNAEEAKKEIPPETRDIVAKICSENDLNISALKEVMEVPPQVISENLENTGFRENDGRITCLRFKDGEKLQGRVVMVQGGKVVDNRMYDDYMNDYMNEHKGQKRIKTIEDEHDKLTYTDLDGNTTVCEIMREPRDLGCSDKERLQEEMAELDLKTEQIVNSDMSLEDKAKAMISVNDERLAIFSKYGITCPTVESEIIADIEIAEEVESNNIPGQDTKELDDDGFDDIGRPIRPGLNH